MKLRLRARALAGYRDGSIRTALRDGFAGDCPSAFGQRCRLLSNVAFDVRLGM